jgi:SAM-dependent methyltransferase
MHASAMAWLRAKVATHDLSPLSTLEVGSYNVHGSPRHLFTGSYVGVDMRSGPGVDEVASAADLPYRDGSFDVVVCAEMLEHDPSPWRSLPEMARVLRVGGWLLLTARGIGFPLHDFPSDYWRFTPSAFGLLFNLAGLVPVEIVADPDPQSPGVFGLARRL